MYIYAHAQVIFLFNCVSLFYFVALPPNENTQNITNTSNINRFDFVYL